jgi:hypothetical protein
MIYNPKRKKMVLNFAIFNLPSLKASGNFTYHQV